MYFVFKNRSSADFGLKIININDLSSSSRRFTKVTVPGRSGDLIIDDGSYENFILNIECDIDAQGNSIEEVSTEIKAWLQSDSSYHTLMLSDKNKYYEAAFISNLDIERQFKDFGGCLLVFDCKPFRKYLNDEKITITEPTKMFNYSSISSSPYMKIYGQGDVTIHISNQSLVLKGIEDFMEVDSEIMNCYKTINGVVENTNNKMYTGFPILKPGENDISWIGNITKIEINPRWVVL